MLKENMSNPIIHLNRKYKIPLDNILCIKQRKRGIYVQFIDPKTKMTLYAIYKGELSNLVTIINTALLMKGDKPLLLIKEA
jgi:hypothetical protein